VRPGGPGQRMAGLLQAVLDLVFPPRCVGCGRVDHTICPECRETIAWLVPPFCARCSRPVAADAAPLDGREVLCEVCRIEPLRLDSIRAVAEHSGVMRTAVHALKYGGQTSLARPLAELMGKVAREEGLSGVDAIVPVPLHPRRLRERGYNQATLMARELARTLSLPILEDVLVRSRATKTQTQLSAAERRVNVVDAFTAEPALLAGRNLLLVDDVCTTGSTLQACADALRRGGAEHVHALTLTRAHWDPSTGVAQDTDGGRAQ
jgi:ComF family protein